MPQIIQEPPFSLTPNHRHHRRVAKAITRTRQRTIKKQMMKSENTSRASLTRYQPKNMHFLIILWIKRKLTVRLRRKYGRGSIKKSLNTLVNRNRHQQILFVQKFQLVALHKASQMMFKWFVASLYKFVVSFHFHYKVSN